MPGNHEPLLQNRFDNIVINSEGDIWCMGRDHFYLFRTDTKHFVDIHSMLEKKSNRRIIAYKIIALKNGYTWLIDENGLLFRIDDKNIENVEVYEKSQSGKTRVYSVLLDSNGNEWVLTSRGLSVVGDISFKSNMPYKNWMERSGKVWLATSRRELAVYHFVRENFRSWSCPRR